MYCTFGYIYIYSQHLQHFRPHFYIRNTCNIYILSESTQLHLFAIFATFKATFYIRNIYIYIFPAEYIFTFIRNIYIDNFPGSIHSATLNIWVKTGSHKKNVSNVKNLLGSVAAKECKCCVCAKCKNVALNVANVANVANKCKNVFWRKNVNVNVANVTNVPNVQVMWPKCMWAWCRDLLPVTLPQLALTCKWIPWAPSHAICTKKIWHWWKKIFLIA